MNRILFAEGLRQLRLVEVGGVDLANEVEQGIVCSADLPPHGLTFSQRPAPGQAPRPAVAGAGPFYGVQRRTLPPRLFDAWASNRLSTAAIVLHTRSGDTRGLDRGDLSPGDTPCGVKR